MRSHKFIFTLVPFVLVTFLSQPVHAQKREDILSIQRDVAQLQDQLAQMRSDQDQKLTALQSMLKQVLDDSAHLSMVVGTLERSIGDRIGQQQIRMEAPMATMGVKVDQTTDEVRSLRENMADLSKRVGNLDAKLTDISSAIRTINTPPVAPPATNATTSAPPGLPPGVNAESLWQNATRDKLSGKDDLALTEFNDYVKYFPQSENAPAAQYQIGDIYWKAKQYDDAALAFDAVQERYAENPKSPDALYMKGASLMAGNRRPEAIVEFKDFLARYPNHSLAAKAQGHLKTLGASTTAVPRTRKKQ